MFMLTVEEANTIQQAVTFWVSAAQRKHDRIRRMQVEAEEAQRELTTSEQADVEYVNGLLPKRIEAARSVLAKIKANSVENVTCPVEVI